MLYDSLHAAIGRLQLCLCRDRARPRPGQAGRRRGRGAALTAPRIAAGEAVAVVFGRERNGLENDEVALADRILTLPVNPAFASLNLAQAVVIVGYEWFKLASGGKLPFAMPEKIRNRAEGAASCLLRPRSNASWRKSSLPAAGQARHNADQSAQHFTRMARRQQDIQTLHGVIMAIAEGRKGPARGGVLDGAEAEMLRALLCRA